MTPAYPFAALVGARELQRALLLGAVDPAVGGVLVRGEKGTAKSTAVRGLAALLPDVAVVPGCRFNCDPQRPDPACPDAAAAQPGVQLRPVPLVELPVGASEDRVVGSLDLERALVASARVFEPGLLARAHRGILYVDEVNLLGDHLVDVLLDAAALGVNTVEREGVSVRHAARFQLVGTMNPEEGELRPQLLDRFGLTVQVTASRDRAERAEVVRRRLAYEADPAGFAAAWADADAAIAERVRDARALLPEVRLGDRALQAVVAACTAFDVDGLRGDIVTAKAATALAAWDGRVEVAVDDVRAAALLALPHRRRRGPFEEPGLDPQRLDEALDGLDDPDGGGDGAPSGGGARRRTGEPAAGDGPPPAPGPAEPAPSLESSADDAGPGHGGEVAWPPDGGEGDAGPPDGGQVGSGPVTLPVGATFDPVLLAVEGPGAGALGRRSPAEGLRGRHTADRPPAGRLGDVALAGTLRAAAPHQRARGRDGPGLVLRAGDLREKVREGREGNLVVFVVDASGSMAARRRMTAVKGAVLSLLLDAYQRRDRVAVVTFRGAGADVALPPTGSVEAGARLLAALPTGGRTPLAAGLERAAALLAAERVRDPLRRPLLVVLTDGRATWADGGRDPLAAALAAGAGLAARRVAAVVVDTEDAAVRLGQAGQVAAALGAAWLRLEDLGAGSLAGVVKAVTAATRRVA